MKFTFRDLIRRPDREADGYSRALQAARVRAAYQRSYFAPALFSLIPVATDLIDSMAVDVHWRLYYNDAWVARHTVEENATLLIHEVGHLLRDHEDARDASQDALAKLCVKLPQFRGESSFTTWLHRLVVNACRDEA